MGLFDFLGKKKTEENSKIDQLRQLLFPGGKIEIDESVKKLRFLTDYRYTAEDTRNTLIHGSVQYFLSKDKSDAHMTGVLLRNVSSTFTKTDISILLNFLKEDFQKKGIITPVLSNLFSDESSKLFMIAWAGVVEIKKFKELTEFGKFEVLLFNSIVVLNEYGKKNPSEYANMVDKLSHRIFSKAENLGINMKKTNFSTS